MIFSSLFNYPFLSVILNNCLTYFFVIHSHTQKHTKDTARINQPLYNHKFPKRGKIIIIFCKRFELAAFSNLRYYTCNGKW